MRTIKFRAWNEEQKYMAYQGTPDLETLQSFIFHFGDKELMQFTGLHDKNGKEIYEGEILYNNDRKENCVVKYDEEKAMFIVEYLESKDKFNLWESISNLYYSVGNINENKYLLK